MKAALPKFEGHQVNAGALKLSGTADEMVGSMAAGEEVFFIGRAVVAKITHADRQGVFTRQHDLKVSALVLMERDEGEKMLSEAALMADERFGIQTLFNQVEGNGGPPPDEK